MILQIFTVENKIYFKVGQVQVLLLDNKKYFSYLLSSIYKLIDGMEIKESITILEDDKMVDFSKDVFIMSDFFTFDSTQRKLVNKLYQHCEKCINEDIELKSKIAES